MLYYTVQYYTVGGLQVPPHRAAARCDDKLPRHRGVRGRRLYIYIYIHISIS